MSDIEDGHKEQQLGSAPAPIIQSWFGPFRLLPVQDLETWRQPKKQCVAGCKVLEQIFTAAGSLS